MKICPTCRRTYDDDALNFCLEDGSVLNFGFDDSAAPTIAMHPRVPNAPPSPMGQASNQPMPVPTQYPHNAGAPVWPSGDAAPNAPKKKKSRGWIWAILILCLGVLICGGGIAGMFVYVASLADNTARVANNNSSNWRSNISSANTSNIDPSRIEEVGLETWAKQKSTWGTNDFRDGELYMASREKGNYFVIVGDDKYRTEKVATRVTLRNTENSDSGLGYGLVIHSDSTPLQNDYAFLIDTKRKRYRIVKHDPDTEIPVVAWTTSNLINEGTSENVIEARDKNGKIELYLNGELATTIVNKGGPTRGVPGLYTGDAAKIAFKKLEIIK